MGNIDELVGVLPALVSPLTKGGSVDEPAVVRLVEHVVDGGVTGLLVLGSTGEIASLDEPSRRAMLSAVMEAARGRVPVICGVAQSHLRAANALASLFVDAHTNGLVIDEMFFGLWLIPLGYLVIRSRQFPWLVGALLLVAAMSWIGQFLANLLAPDLPYVFEVGQVGGAGEFVFVVWLLIFGIKVTDAGARDSAVSVPA